MPKRIVALLGFAAAVFFICGPAAAQEGEFAVGPVVGTLGVGLEATMRVHPTVIIRGTGTFLTLPSVLPARGSSSNFGPLFTDTQWTLDLASKTAGLTLDWHPSWNGVRLSTGLRYVDLRMSGTPTTRTPEFIAIGGTVYDTTLIGPVSAVVSNDTKILPYVGMGYDSAFFNSGHFSVGLDMGVLIGAYGSSSVHASGVAKSDLDKEQQIIDSRLPNLYGVFPVVTLSAHYRF